MTVTPSIKVDTGPSGDERHYLVDGQLVPSVSDLLNILQGDRWQPPEHYRVRGTKFHNLAHLVMKGTGWEPKHPVSVKWKNIVNQVKGDIVGSGEIVAIERPLFSSNYRYCGTPDLVYRKGDRFYILDWKTGVIKPRDRLQLFFYLVLLRSLFDQATYGNVFLRLIYISSNNVDYNAVPFVFDKNKYESYLNALKSALNVYSIREKLL